MSLGFVPVINQILVFSILLVHSGKKWPIFKIFMKVLKMSQKLVILPYCVMDTNVYLLFAYSLHVKSYVGNKFNFH